MSESQSQTRFDTGSPRTIDFACPLTGQERIWNNSITWPNGTQASFDPGAYITRSTDGNQWLCGETIQGSLLSQYRWNPVPHQQQNPSGVSVPASSRAPRPLQAWTGAGQRPDPVSLEQTPPQTRQNTSQRTAERPLRRLQPRPPGNGARLNPSIPASPRPHGTTSQGTQLAPARTAFNPSICTPCNQFGAYDCQQDGTSGRCQSCARTGISIQTEERNPSTCDFMTALRYRLGEARDRHARDTASGGTA